VRSAAAEATPAKATAVEAAPAEAAAAATGKVAEALLNQFWWKREKKKLQWKTGKRKPQFLHFKFQISN
jgi:hypothetical protein